MLIKHADTYRSTEFCSDPLEALQILRKRLNSGKPIPELMLITNPHNDKVLENLQIKLKKLTGGCGPELLVVGK